MTLFPHYFSEEVVLRKNSGASLAGSVLRNGITKRAFLSHDHSQGLIEVVQPFMALANHALKGAMAL